MRGLLLLALVAASVLAPMPSRAEVGTPLCDSVLDLIEAGKDRYRGLLTRRTGTTREVYDIDIQIPGFGFCEVGVGAGIYRCKPARTIDNYKEARLEVYTIANEINKCLPGPWRTQRTEKAGFLESDEPGNVGFLFFHTDEDPTFDVFWLDLTAGVQFHMNNPGDYPVKTILGIE